MTIRRRLLAAIVAAGISSAAFAHGEQVLVDIVTYGIPSLFILGVVVGGAIQVYSSHLKWLGWSYLALMSGPVLFILAESNSDGLDLILFAVLSTTVFGLMFFVPGYFLGRWATARLRTSSKSGRDSIY